MNFFERDSHKINFREENGLFAFPNETPIRTRFAQATMRALGVADVVPVPPVIGPYVIFLDVSKWNPFYDYSLAYERGIRAVWVKANQGAWTDSLFDTHVKGFTDAGIEIGFYEYLDPGQSITPENAASLHYNLTNGKGKLSSWLDSEKTAGLSPSKLLDYYVRWYETLAGLANDKRIIETYTRFSFFNYYVQESDFWRNNQVGLNAARYHMGLQSPWSDGNYRPRDWDFGLNEYDKWQYSADGNGMGNYFGCSSKSIDINLFSGTQDDFDKRYGLSETDPGCCEELRVEIEAIKLELIVIDTEQTAQNKAITTNADKIRILEDLIGDPIDPDPEYIEVVADIVDDEGKQLKCSVYRPNHWDAKCPGKKPPGKPVIGNKITVLPHGTSFRIYKSGVYSCRDDANTPNIKTASGDGYYMIYNGAYDGDIVPASRLRII